MNAQAQTEKQAYAAARKALVAALKKNSSYQNAYNALHVDGRATVKAASCTNDELREALSKNGYIC
jgi:hypothetical protein